MKIKDDLTIRKELAKSISTMLSIETAVKDALDNSIDSYFRHNCQEHSRLYGEEGRLGAEEKQKQELADNIIQQLHEIQNKTAYLLKLFE